MNNVALKINNVSRKDGGTYFCKAENILGTAVTTVQLMVFSHLRFRVRPPAQLTAVVGNPEHLPCVAESSLKPTITWMKDGKPSLPVDSSILQNNTLVISSVKKSHARDLTPLKRPMLYRLYKHKQVSRFNPIPLLPVLRYGNTSAVQAEVTSLIQTAGVAWRPLQSTVTWVTRMVLA